MDYKKRALDIFKELVRRKLAAAREAKPGPGWEEYYRGRLSALEEVEAVMRDLGI